MNKCKQCGLETTNPKFCSRSCASSFNNRLNKPKKSSCMFCGTSLVGKSGKRFCSNSCHNKYKRETYIVGWKKGVHSGMRGEYGISKTIRNYLFEKYNNKCCVCGWCEINPHTGKIPLEVDHIDGDYKNNKESNLRLLCPNCHSLTGTYRSLNKTGRKGRKKYYNASDPFNG